MFDNLFTPEDVPDVPFDTEAVPFKGKVECGYCHKSFYLEISKEIE